jgi:hypothetical protein
MRMTWDQHATLHNKAGRITGVVQIGYLWRCEQCCTLRRSDCDMQLWRRALALRPQGSVQSVIEHNQLPSLINETVCCTPLRKSYGATQCLRLDAITLFK